MFVSMCTHLWNKMTILLLFNKLIISSVACDYFSLSFQGATLLSRFIFLISFDICGYRSDSFCLAL